MMIVRLATPFSDMILYKFYMDIYVGSSVLAVSTTTEQAIVPGHLSRLPLGPGQNMAFIPGPMASWASGGQGPFIPVGATNRDQKWCFYPGCSLAPGPKPFTSFFLSSACGSVYISLISISPPILPSLSYLLPSPTLPPLVAQPERLTERRAAGGEAPGGGFGHGGGSARVASERR